MLNVFYLKVLLTAILFLPEILNANSVQTDSTTLFESIYAMEGRPRIVIDTKVKALIRKKMKEEYQEANFQLQNQTGDSVLTLSARIKARGNVRKSMCYLPPVKLDFKKSDLRENGMLELDDLKFVLPADSRTISQERLLKEYFLYQLYEKINPISLKTKLVDLVFMEGEKERYAFSAFIVEDKKHFVYRKQATLIESGNIRASGLDRNCFYKMIGFQYMIANIDYSVSARHNLQVVKFPDRKRVVAIPYDFDFSGFVGHEYAVPPEHFPIASVSERFMFPNYRITEKEFVEFYNYFLQLEPQLYKLCISADYMNESTRQECKAYIESFYTLLKYSKKLKQDLVRLNNS